MAEVAKIVSLPKVEEPVQVIHRSIEWKAFDKVKVKLMEWYDEPWLPKVGIAGLAGPPDVGKSTYFIHEIANLTTGQYGCEPVKVMYLTSEDDEDTVYLRLKLAGADLSRVITGKIEVKVEEDAYKTEIELSKDLELLSDLVRQERIKAVYLDPANSYLGVDEDRDGYSRIRLALHRLEQFAREEEILVRAMKHLKKAQVNTDKLPVTSMVYGSQAWTEVIRIFPILWPVTDKLKEQLDLEQSDKTNRLLLRGKNNRAPHSLPAKALYISASNVVEEGVTHKGVTFMESLGVRSVTNDDVVSKPMESKQQKDDRNKKEASSSEAWLVGLLEDNDGSMPVKDVKAICEVGGEGVPSYSTARRIANSSITIKTVSIEGSTTNEKAWEISQDKSIWGTM